MNRSCVLHRVEPEKLIIMATVQALHDFHDWLSEHEEKLEEYAANKPKTRVQACQLLAIATDMSKIVEEKSLPDEIYMAHYEFDDDDEEEVDRGDLIRRFRTLRTNVADNLARIETLCVCWDKLNADMSELTKALNSGGAGKLTVEKLEDSISQLKEMFRERATLIENMASTPGAAEDDVDDYY